MKHLLNGVAIAAALAIAGPVWAQAQSPSAPGATPYTSGGTPPPPSTSATPPEHHPMHPVAHTRAMHYHHKGMAAKAAASGNATAALNREELARINAGNLSSPPPAAPMPEGPPPPTQPRSGSSKYLPTGGPKLH